jgi:hypothetical protein
MCRKQPGTLRCTRKTNSLTCHTGIAIGRLCEKCDCPHLPLHTRLARCVPLHRSPVTLPQVRRQMRHLRQLRQALHAGETPPRTVSCAHTCAYAYIT